MVHGFAPAILHAAMAGNWQNYDYRAVTAGTVITAIATIVMLSTPARSVQCRRTDAVCEVVDTKPLSEQRRPVPVASIEKATRSCVRSSGAPECKWSVRFNVKGSDGQLFEGISDSAESERMVRELNAFLDRKTDSVSVRRPADRMLGWVFLAIGAVLVVLGIRKNLADKGY